MGSPRIGITVGPETSDAVLLDSDNVVLATGRGDTTQAAGDGLNDALQSIVRAHAQVASAVDRVVVSFAFSIDTLVAASALGRVATIRIGYPAAAAVPPLATWPPNLAATISVGSTSVSGGHDLNGRKLGRLDIDAIRRFLLRVRNSTSAVAVCSVFSSVDSHDETMAEQVAREILGDVVVSLGHELGTVGLVERENATIINAALIPVLTDALADVEAALALHEIDAPVLVVQGDGTIALAPYAARFPIHTLRGSLAGAMSGASHLAELPNAVVIAVDAERTDIGIVSNGTPRSRWSRGTLSGVRVNLRAPDTLQLDWGYHSSAPGRSSPESTASATAPSHRRPRSRQLVQTGFLIESRGRCDSETSPDSTLAAYLVDALDRVEASSHPHPVVAVGRGGHVVPESLGHHGVVLHPLHSTVASAVGAAMGQIGGYAERIASRDGRAHAVDRACDDARARAVLAGAAAESVEVTEIQETPLPYSADPSLLIRVRASGQLGHR